MAQLGFEPRQSDSRAGSLTMAFCSLSHFQRTVCINLYPVTPSSLEKTKVSPVFLKGGETLQLALLLVNETSVGRVFFSFRVVPLYLHHH